MYSIHDHIAAFLELPAMELVQIPAGHADDPCNFVVMGRMNGVGWICPGIARSHCVAIYDLQFAVAPVSCFLAVIFTHMCGATRIGINGPGWSMGVRITSNSWPENMGEDMDVSFPIVMEQPFVWRVCMERGCDEILVGNKSGKLFCYFRQPGFQRRGFSKEFAADVCKMPEWIHDRFSPPMASQRPGITLPWP